MKSERTMAVLCRYVHEEPRRPLYFDFNLHQKLREHWLYFERDRDIAGDDEEIGSCVPENAKRMMAMYEQLLALAPKPETCRWAVWVEDSYPIGCLFVYNVPASLTMADVATTLRATGCALVEMAIGPEDAWDCSIWLDWYTRGTKDEYPVPFLEWKQISDPTQGVSVVIPNALAERLIALVSGGKHTLQDVVVDCIARVWALDDEDSTLCRRCGIYQTTGSQMGAVDAIWGRPLLPNPVTGEPAEWDRT